MLHQRFHKSEQEQPMVTDQNATERPCYYCNNNSSQQQQRRQQPRMKRQRPTSVANSPKVCSGKKQQLHWRIIVISRTLCLIELLHFACGEDQTSSSSSQQYAAENAMWRQKANKDRGLVLTEDFCNRNYIQISRMTILCDTPGAYYYGSNAYRNSEVCMSGDKAKLNVTCELCKRRCSSASIIFSFC